ncbi:MAG: hypothetical protein AAF616_05775 [Bacteroidota bacterium]
MKVVSAIFHPLLIATHVASLFLLTVPALFAGLPASAKQQLLLLVFLLTGAMPALSIFMMKTFKLISDLELSNRRERTIPFAFILFYYILACYLFAVQLELNYLFNLVMISVTVLIFVLLLISTRFKISIHAAAIWSAVGYLTGMIFRLDLGVQNIYYLIVALAGLTVTSRLYLDYHTPKEVWTGSILGFLYSLSIVLIMT